MLSLPLSIPLRSATPREGTVGSDTKAERNGDGKVMFPSCSSSPPYPLSFGTGSALRSTGRT